MLPASRKVIFRSRAGVYLPVRMRRPVRRRPASRVELRLAASCGLAGRRYSE